MRTILLAFLASVFFDACSGPTPAADPQKEPQKGSFKIPPAAIVEAIKTKFPKAVPYQEGVDSLVNHLKQYGIQADQMLWGQSTCVDDITNTKDKLNSE